jgi:hypothetical protein
MGRTVLSKHPISFVSVLSLIIILTIGSLLAFDEDEEDRLFHEGIDHNGHTHDYEKHHHDSGVLPKDKVLLSAVKTLTFTRHKRTTSRRTHSIHQLTCVGGTAGCKLFTPNVVECHNDGIDKTTGKVQWRCQADMSDRVRFNHVEVICEGYDYPEDDYILLGSCGLEFTLDYADPHDYHEKSYFKHMDEHEKEMHHERVRSQNKPAKASEPSMMAVAFWLFGLLGNHSLLFIIAFMLLATLTILKTRLYSRLTTARATGSKGKRQSGGGGGGVSSGYGPLTSAVMTTKKAC